MALADNKRFQAKNGLDNNGKTIENVLAPVNDSDAATKGFSRDASNLTTGTLPAARLPAMSGDLSSAGGTAAISLAATGVAAGTVNDSATALSPLTIDAKGRVTAVGLPITITPSFASLTSKPTTLAGYGISDGLLASEVVTVAAPNKLLKLDSGSKLPASITGNADGNASTATKLQTARSIGMSGDLTWTIAAFDGAADVTAAATLANSGVGAGTYRSVTVDAKGRVTSGSNPTTLAGYGITDAAALVHNHALGGLTDVTITANSNGEILKWNGTAWVNNTLAEAGIQPAGSYLTGNQSITVSGDASGSGTTAISLTLANSGVGAGTYRSVTVDAKGRVTSGSNPTTLAGYGITDAAASTHNHTVNGLSNVVITSVADGHVLTWDSATSKWINRAPAAGGTIDGGSY